MVLEREGLHLERRRQEASSKVVQRQHRVLLSWVRDDAGRQTSSAIIPHGRASRTLGKNQRFAALPERFAVWPQKDKKWHMERLLGALHRPCQKVHIIPYLLHHATCHLPKTSLCHKGLWQSTR